MVTGATGYVAGWVVKRLLDEGITVHAPVRNPNNKEKVEHLVNLASSTKGEIIFFEADLLHKGSYKEAMQGCELVFHTASPFINSVTDPQKQLVDPALLGTKNVLETANETTTVKRVVLTSSCVAIVGDAKDLLDIPNGIVDESHWNHSSTLHHQPYNYSKTLAEREAWKICSAQKRWDMVVINPSFVLGPGIKAVSSSESFNIIKQMADGTMKAGTPAIHIGCVDVRDLGTAHYRAGFVPEAEGRHIVSNESTTFLEIAETLRQHFGDKYAFPTRELPKALVWLFGPLQGIKRKMVSRNVGYKWLVDNTKSKEKLKIEYTDLKKTLVDFFKQMVDAEVFQK